LSIFMTERPGDIGTLRRILTIGSLLTLVYGHAGAVTYYIDSENGNDANPGTSAGEAWRTTARIPQVPMATGDTVYFRGGMQYEENLALYHVSGIVITSDKMNRATVDAGGGSALHLMECSKMQVSNLDFRGNGRLSGNTADGVILEDCRDMILDNLTISGFQHSGLLVSGASANITVTYVHSLDNGFAGIHVFGKWPDRYKCKNIHIGHCQAENNPGDPTVLDNHSGNGIIVGTCDSVLIEYCKALENGWDMPRQGNGPVGIWAWNADHVTIQHCISHHNKTSPGGSDGGGFDLDGGVRNSIIRYCLSYENEGAGYGIFEYQGADTLKNNTLRYNISVDDGIKNGKCALAVWNENPVRVLLRDVKIYNNVFLNRTQGGSAVYFLDDLHEGLMFANNLFISEGSILKGTSTHSGYYGNVYWNLGSAFHIGAFTTLCDWISATGYEILGDSIVGMNADPMLAGPLTVTLTDPDSMDLEKLAGLHQAAG
jgi:hypothetical protein